MLLPWQHSWLQSPSMKNEITHFATFESGTEGLACRDTHGPHIVQTLLIRLLRVNDPCLRQNLGILVLKQEQRITSIMVTGRRISCCFFCDVHF